MGSTAENDPLAVVGTEATAETAGGSRFTPTGQSDRFSAVSTVSNPDRNSPPARTLGHTAARAEMASLEGLVDVFVAGADLSPPSVRVYRQALDRVAVELDGPVSLETMDAEHLEHAVGRAWGDLAPAT